MEQNKFIQDVYNNLIYADRWKLLMNGLGLTMKITIAAIIIGTVLGIISAFMKISKHKILNIPAKIYIGVIRGTPVMIQLLIIYNVIFGSVDMDKTIIAIIAFGVNSGAYMAEIFRGGILSVDKGQVEAGRSLGLRHWQTMWHIILPQALKNCLPTYISEFITLIKETSIVGYIALDDLTRSGDIIQSNTYSPLVPLVSVAIIYLSITLILTWLFNKLERRLRESDLR